MYNVPSYVKQDARPAQGKSTLWGCSGLVMGLVIGAVLTVLGLVVFAPQPEAAKPITGGTAGNLTISMDDIYLTQVVGAAVSQASLPISLSKIQVEIQPNNRVKISGNASSLIPGNNQMVATSAIEVRSGVLAMRILSAQVGGLTLPGAVSGALENAINAKLAAMTQALLPEGYAITGVSTTAHHLQLAISRG